MKTRKAIVTGATSGIGLEISKLFLEHNIDVVLSGRSINPPSFLDKYPNNSAYFSCDLTNDDSVDNLLHFSQKKFSMPPDIFVVNAGVGLAGTLLTSNSERWEELFNVNCISTFHQIKKIAEIMINSACNIKDDSFKQDIVIISSIIGRVVSEANPVYGATKFALTSLAESLRKEICQYSIRVTVIEPGFVKTNFQQRAGYDLKAFENMEQLYGPFLSPEDIAQQVLFAINQPKYINISNLTIRPTRQKP